MPDLPISGLPAVTIPSSSYTLAVVSASVTSKMSVKEIGNALSGSIYIASASYATTSSYWNGALWQLNDTMVTPTSSIPDGYRLTWNSGSQKWDTQPSALQSIPVRLFVAADTSNTAAFYFNSMTRTADSSANPNADTAFMLTNISISTASLYLRNDLASTNGITASLYQNANGAAFSSATLVQALSGSLVQNTVTAFDFNPVSFSQYNSFHFRITPGVGGANTYYGVIIVR